jgi:hypothetical protein
MGSNAPKFIAGSAVVAREPIAPLLETGNVLF